MPEGPSDDGRRLASRRKRRHYPGNTVVFSIPWTREFGVLARPHQPGLCRRSPRRAIRALSTPESRAASTSVIIIPRMLRKKTLGPNGVWWSTKIWRRCAMGMR